MVSGEMLGRLLFGSLETLVALNTSMRIKELLNYLLEHPMLDALDDHLIIDHRLDTAVIEIHGQPIHQIGGRTEITPQHIDTWITHLLTTDKPVHFRSNTNPITKAGISLVMRPVEHETMPSEHEDSQ